MTQSFTFYLGTHQPAWLARVDVPLFISRRRIYMMKRLPRATCNWALDSGGFSELSLFGKWTIDARPYVAEVRRYRDEVGRMDWAAIQDWMCEPWILEKTGLTIAEHQRRTIDSYAELLSLAPEVPWVPVLQGWESDDYLRHRDEYAARGFDLSKLEHVGVGSVCRRQGTQFGVRLMQRMFLHGISVHAFGYKKTGLAASHSFLRSADSMAWSFCARRAAPLPGHEARHKNCANCVDYALMWRSDLLAMLGPPMSGPEQQLEFPEAA